MTTVYRSPVDSLLTARGLTIGYGNASTKHSLFENLDLSLLKGELVCFMGPNGIGKSTLIRTLAGLQKPLSGTVDFNGETALPKKVSVVLTDRITATHLGVYELITFGRYPYLDWSIKLSEADAVIIQQAIDSVNINHLVNKRLYELSDGQLQMVMIARALTQDCEIILLDEPTAHLDLNNRVEIMNLLKKLARETGKAILVATHELDLALQTADCIWLAGRDKKILTGLPEELVLNGAFDEVFQFKGFDLKTGKIRHEAYRNIEVNLQGTGHEYLWTKNALERNGYEVNTDANVSIIIQKENNVTTWRLVTGDGTTLYVSLGKLLEAVKS